MFVLDVDEALPADDDGSPWLYVTQNTSYYAHLGVNAAVGVGVKYGSNHVGRIGLRGAQDAPLRYVVDSIGRIALTGAVTQGVRYQTIVNGASGLRADSQVGWRQALALVGRVGFNAANFGGSSLQTLYPIWAFPDPPTFQIDADDELIVALDDQLIVEDIGAGHFGVNLFGALGARAAAETGPRYVLTEAATVGFNAAQVNVFHGTADLVGRAALSAAMRVILAGEEVAYLGARGVITVEARYATALAARMAARGATEEQIHWAIIESGQLVLRGATSEAFHSGLDLATRLGLQGANLADLPPGFEVIGRILTADGSPVYLVRRESRL